VLALRDDGVLRVHVMPIAYGPPQPSIGFGSVTKFVPKDLEVLDDLNGNGTPELALLSENSQAGKPDKVAIRDSFTGNVVRNLWFGTGTEPQQVVVLPDVDGDGFPELGVLREGDPTVVVKSATTGALVANVEFRQDDYEPRALGVIADGTGNGVPDLAMFGFRPWDHKVRAQVKEVGSPVGSTVSKAFFGTSFSPEAFAIVPDANGNQSPDLVRLGYSRDDGQLSAAVRDGTTGQAISAGSP